MKKINLLTAAAAVLFLTACAQEASAAEEEPFVIINGSQLSQEEIAAYSAPEVEPILNDGNFYFMGDTNACYFTVKDGCAQLIVGEPDSMKYFYYAAETSYYFRKREEGLSPGIIGGFDEYYESEKTNWAEPKPYEINTNSLGTYVIFDPYYDEDGIGPGGIFIDYIDEDNIGYMESEIGGIDLIFTRVDDSE